jgi:endonuclease/exonuclease/phosphatase family metal-dependent hydrolase
MQMNASFQGSRFLPVLTRQSHVPSQAQTQTKAQIQQSIQLLPYQGIHTVRFAGIPQRQFKLMSYNFENFFPSVNSAKFVSQQKTPVKKPESVQALADVILKEQPDIVAVQEAEHGNALAEFAKTYLNGQYEGFCADQANDPRNICTGFLYKKGLDFVSKRTFNVQGPQGAPLLTRNVAEATFKVTTPDGCGQELTVMSAHFKAMVGGEEKTHPRRMQEAKAVVNRVQTMVRENPSRNLVLMGDLNFKVSSRQGQEVFSELSKVTQSNGQPGWFEAFSPDFPATHQFKGEGNKLDYIFLTKTLFQDQIQAKVSGSFNQDPWRKASDHLPPTSEIKARCDHQVWGNEGAQSSTSQSSKPGPIFSPPVKAKKPKKPKPKLDFVA